MVHVPDYYEFLCPVKILSGNKALSNLPHEMGQLGRSKALVVTDEGVVGAGLLKRSRRPSRGARVRANASMTVRRLIPPTW